MASWLKINFKKPSVETREFVIHGEVWKDYEVKTAHGFEIRGKRQRIRFLKDGSVNIYYKKSRSLLRFKRQEFYNGIPFVLKVDAPIKHVSAILDHVDKRFKE